MKHVIFTPTGLVVKGNAQGSVIITFALISGIIFLILGRNPAGFGFLGLGLLLLLIGLIQAMVSSKRIYLEISQEMLLIYPTGKTSMRYEVPLVRVSYLTHVHRQRSGNTDVLTLKLNQQPEPACRWINGNFNEILNKKELDLEYLPIKQKDEVAFIATLNQKFALKYQAPEKTFLGLHE